MKFNSLLFGLLIVLTCSNGQKKSFKNQVENPLCSLYAQDGANCFLTWVRKMCPTRCRVSRQTHSRGIPQTNRLSGTAVRNTMPPLILHTASTKEVITTEKTIPVTPIPIPIHTATVSWPRTPNPRIFGSGTTLISALYNTIPPTMGEIQPLTPHPAQPSTHVDLNEDQEKFEIPYYSTIDNRQKSIEITDKSMPFITLDLASTTVFPGATENGTINSKKLKPLGNERGTKKFKSKEPRLIIVNPEIFSETKMKGQVKEGVDKDGKPILNTLPSKFRLVCKLIPEDPSNSDSRNENSSDAIDGELTRAISSTVCATMRLNGSCNRSIVCLYCRQTCDYPNCL